MLRFLVRLVFWASIAILLVPADPKDGSADANAALDAAQRILTDASGFCGRNPEVCVTTGSLADTFKRKAQAAARRIYAFGRSQFENATAAGDTLSPDDHKPEWRKPAKPPG